MLRDGRVLSLGTTLVVGTTLLGACHGSSSAGPSLPAEDDTCAGPCPTSLVKHVVIVIQENHTFDDHFGRWCSAPAGSNPACTTGPACCEAAPSADARGTVPSALDDSANALWDPPHDSTCESAEMDQGKMDDYATAPGCGDARNVAVAGAAVMQPLWSIASAGAVADRYFQPVVGESYANDMYFAEARYVFADDSVAPLDAVGVECGLESEQELLTGTTLGDLLTGAHVPWAFYAEGYTAMKDADGGCPPKPADCPFPFAFDPCGFEPSDVPFEYYASTRDDPTTMKDYSDLEAALVGGGLPAVSFVKALEYKTEHPGSSVTLSAGVAFVADLVQRVASSRYRADTLVLVTYDEGGGYFDHVTPPAASAVDNRPYGTRVPLVAAGPFAMPGKVSHVVMEHSSLVKFVEWNFLGGATGQLHARDAVVADIGSLLDPSKTGTPVPAD